MFKRGGGGVKGRLNNVKKKLHFWHSKASLCHPQKHEIKTKSKVWLRTFPISPHTWIKWTKWLFKKISFPILAASRAIWVQSKLQDHFPSSRKIVFPYPAFSRDNLWTFWPTSIFECPPTSILQPQHMTAIKIQQHFFCGNSISMKAEFSSLAHHHITLCNCTIGKCFINATLLVRAVVKKKTRSFYGQADRKGRHQ